MDQNIYRKVSIDRLSSPEQLDRFIIVTSSKLWITLLAVASILAAVILWGITGSISTNISGDGMLITSGGTIEICSSCEGQISDIRVVAGEYIEEGEIVARMKQDDLVDEITILMEKIESLKASGADDNEILDYEQQITARRNKLAESSVIISQKSGRVTGVNVAIGDKVELGTSVVSIVDEDKDESNLMAVFYVPAASGKKIKVGMKTKISPSIVQEEAYGCMLGRVVSVSEYPVSVKAAAKKLGNNTIAEAYAGNNLCLEVLAELEINKKTESGYRWSTEDGPPLKLENGTVCSAFVIVDTQRPIEKVFPQMKSLFGR